LNRNPLERICGNEEARAQVSERIQEIAERANVPEPFVRQLVAAGALPAEESELGFRGEVRRARLLWSWTAAGLPVETVLALINRGALSLAFLDAPVMDLPERLDRSYEQLAADGMFYFREPGTAVVAGLDLVERGPAVDLPPAHIGIHTGRVISQDGDVYGRTVNLAARIASYAQAGQVVVSHETAQRCGDRQVRFDSLGAVELKGVAKPLALYHAYRRS
jgi:hypothetical protein